MSITSYMRAYGARPLLLGGALVGIVVVSALAVRESMLNAQHRKAAAERTVRDYAMFASYLYSTRAYLFARDRANLAYLPLHPGDPWVRGALPPVTVLPPIPDTTEKCGPAASWPVYRFRIDMPSRVVTYAGERPTPEIDRIIRDSIPVLANRDWPKRAGFGYLFVDGPLARETIAYSPALDTAKNVLAVYGYRSCYGVRDTMDYAQLYKVVKVMPPMVPGYNQDLISSTKDSAHRASEAMSERMTGKWPMGMPPESLLTLTITDVAQKKLFQSPTDGASSNYYGMSPAGFIGGTLYWVALRPDAVHYLVAGGIPESRVPASLLLLAGSIVLAITGFASLRSEIRLVNSRQRFLANVSHELRTPLQQILMFVQLLRLGRTRTEAEREQSLEIIERETHRLISLSNAVLATTPRETAAGEAGSDLHLKAAPVDVANVVQSAADFFAPLAEARKMRIDLDMAHPAMACGDSRALRQILINVLDNAAKYGPIGQTIKVGVRTEGKIVRLWVDDSGPGIPASQRDKVWNPFFRIGGTLDDSTGGAGLGLSIVRQLATAMEADAALSETPTGGTRFTLVLPASLNGTAP
jgi:signal transduction histidine kinase